MLTEANGLLYMRARYYSPDMMRFINEDIVTGDISNSNSLNRYSYVEGNPVTMVDPFGLEAKRIGNYSFFDLKDDLIEAGWSDQSITDEYVCLLYMCIIQHDITTTDRLRMFLAQCQYETCNGLYFRELGSDAYLEGKRYGKKYSGAGAIQLTWKYGYQAFAVYEMLENVPELSEEIIYRNPKNNGSNIIDREYEKAKEVAVNRGIDITPYTDIVDLGADYVADVFPWEVAGYYWDVNDLNRFADDLSFGMDAITAIINKNTTLESYEKRKNIYELYCEKNLFNIE